MWCDGVPLVIGCLCLIFFGLLFVVALCVVECVLFVYDVLVLILVVCGLCLWFVSCCVLDCCVCFCVRCVCFMTVDCCLFGGKRVACVVMVVRFVACACLCV